MNNNNNLFLFPEYEPELLQLADDATVVVSLSGGKDSVATLLAALERWNALGGRGRVLAHHQVILEDWPRTIEYCQQLCQRLEVPLYMSQAVYYGYECGQCGKHYLTSLPVGHCRACGSREDQQFLTVVDSVLDLVEWRQAWPSLDVRFCTSYFKRDNFNKWAREQKAMLGDQVVVAMGERWRESKGRSKLPPLRKRSKLEWMIEWRPILDCKRIDVFRKMRDYNIEPHYCYQAQGMTEYQMYEENKEGGPRMSCVMCFLKSEEQMRASYHAPEGRDIMEHALSIEASTGHRITKDHSLHDMLAPVLSPV